MPSDKQIQLGVSSQGSPTEIPRECSDSNEKIVNLVGNVNSVKIMLESREASSSAQIEEDNITVVNIVKEQRKLSLKHSCRETIHHCIKVYSNKYKTNNST